jgi:MFS family permease
VLLTFTAGIIVFGLSFGWFLDPSTVNKPMMLVFLSVGMALMGLSFGPMSALLPELFPTNVRYTGSGIAYNFASIIGAAVAPFIATWLVHDFGVAWVGVYLSIAGVLTFVALLAARETRGVDLAEV